jgi:putative tryptophan/tyrosine transport system substrate-binding protein
MNRRELITLLGGAAAWPLTARAQRPTMPVLGYLNSRGRSEDPHLLAAFRQGLKETGHVEGQESIRSRRDLCQVSIGRATTSRA